MSRAEKYQTAYIFMTRNNQSSVTHTLKIITEKIISVRNLKNVIDTFKLLRPTRWKVITYKEKILAFEIQKGN